MTNTIIGLDVAVKLASQAAESTYKPIRGKKIMFESVLQNGERIILCSPLSKFHESFGGYWVDITSVQHALFEQYDKALLVFRLQGNKLSMVKWADLKSLLTPESMRNSIKEGNHWKLHIFDHDIDVQGGDRKLKVDTIIMQE